MVMVTITASRRNYPRRARATLRELWHSFVDALPGLATPAIIVGGILSGIFTPTEAAAIAVLYAFIIGVFAYRELKWPDIRRILFESMKDTAILGFIISCAMLYGWLLIRSRIPIVLLDLLTSITTNRLAILLILNGFLLIIGCFMETIAAITILVPVLTPLLAKVGIDPLHFGLIMVLNLMIGLLTPPFGVVLFILNKISGVPLGRIVRVTFPFLIPLLVVLLLITIFPPLVTYLPNLFL